MVFSLKNAEDTYQTLIDTIFKGLIRWNVKMYVDVMVVKFESY